MRETEKAQDRQDVEKYQLLVLDYRKKGMTFREMETATGVPKATLHAWIKKLEKKAARLVKPEVQEAQGVVSAQ